MSTLEYGFKKKKSHKNIKVNKVEGRKLLEVMKEEERNPDFFVQT